MIKDLLTIYKIISDIIYLHHPLTMEIRYLFCQNVNDKCWSSKEEWEGVASHNHYTLKSFLTLLIKDHQFRWRVIQCLSKERRKCLNNIQNFSVFCNECSWCGYYKDLYAYDVENAWWIKNACPSCNARISIEVSNFESAGTQLDIKYGTKT